MTTITDRTFDAGTGVGRGTGDPNLSTTFQEVADDVAALRASLVGITAKLDADAGVTDTDYAATHDPAAMKTIRG